MVFLGVILFCFEAVPVFTCGCFCQPPWTAKETALIRTVRLSFAFLLSLMGLVMALSEGRAVMLAVSLRETGSAAAFSVFFGLQVTNFYVFLGCHNFSFLVSGFWFVLMCKMLRTTNGARHQRHFP